MSRILFTGGVLSQHALQQVSRGVVSQHARQVSRPTPKGEVLGDLVEGGSPGPQPRGKLRGIWSRPPPKGEVEGDLARGVPTLGGVCSRGGVSAPGGCLL